MLATAFGCGRGLQFNLVINDPCNQQVLGNPSIGIKHIELEIRSSELDGPVGTIWGHADRQGELRDLPSVPDATVSVIARAGNANGDPGDVLAATSVGLVDLSGAEGRDEVALNVVIGRLDTFISATDSAAASDGLVECTKMVVERRGHSATRLEDGRVFIAGGKRVNPTSLTYWESTEVYDPTTGIFTQGPVMMWVREAHTATLLEDGRVFIAGGIGLNGGSIDTWKVALVYDPGAASFLPPIPMKEQRTNHTATLLGDGRVLLAGGRLGTRELQTTEIFDPVTMTSCMGPTLSQPRAFHAAVRIGQQGVALIGGQGSGQVLGVVEFVPVSGCNQGTAEAGPTLTPRSHVAAAMAPGKDAIVVAGGFGAVVQSPETGTGLNVVEVIKLNLQSPADSGVCTGLTLAGGRGAASVATLPEGILVVGGIGSTSLPITTAETIRVNNTASCDVTISTTTGSLATGRAGAVATALFGGDVLVTGGFGIDGGLVSSSSAGELYIRRR